MKALEILEGIRHRFSWVYGMDEAIEELKTLQSNYDEIQQELSDANEAYLVLLRQYHETHSIIEKQEKRLNEYADMIYEASKPKTCDGCKHNRFGSGSDGIAVDCILIGHGCKRGLWKDCYEPKENK